ncbi:copper resistance CopC family protein [Actinoplanes sp. NPDC051470]|uniref:copper resistance CopC family protein n=1 Tax=Actinoplanes sp. NPDC051470 TaxID=3157224 RepID=UPI0034284EAE
MGRSPRTLLGLLLVGVLAGAVVAPSAALAHGTLVTSEPAQGSTVQERVEAVTLTFTEKPPPGAQFTIKAPTGVRVDGGWSNGEPHRLATPVREYQLKDGQWEPLLLETGFPVKIAVSHLPAPGEYTVTYHHTVSDGDAVKGEIRFTYHGAVVAAPPGWQAPASAAPLQAPVQAPSPVAEAQILRKAVKNETTVWVWLVPVLLVVAVGLCALLIVPQLRRRASGKPGGRSVG